MAQLPGDLILGRNGDNGASTALRSLFTRNPAKSLPVESNGGGPIPGGVVEPLPKPPHMGDRVRTDPGGIFGRIWFLPFREPISLGETPAMRLAYREMMRSPFVKAGVLTKVLAVASQDWQIQPADDENPRDQQVAKFVKHVFEGMQGGLHEAIIQCLVPTLLDGYGLAEKVWGLEERGTYRGSVIGHLKQKDTQYFQLIGTPERVVDQFYLWRTGESFPPETFLYTRYLPIYDSPTGMSDMRAAYADYWMLDTVTKLRAIAAEKFTLPFMLGKWTNKEDKSPLENALQNARGATWMAVPQGVQVEAIQIAQKSEGDFKSFVDDCQKRILIAILGAYLQTLEGQINNGRGNTKVSKSITELFGWYLSCLFQQAVNEQFIPDLIDYNFRDVGYPKLTLGAISGEEITQLLAQFESAERIGLQVSKKDAYSRLSIQPPEDPNDVLTPQGQLRPMNKDGIPSKRVGMGGLGGPIPGGDQPPPDGQTAGQIPGGPQNPQGQQGPPQANGKPPFKPTGIQSSNTPDPADSNAGVGDTRDLAEWYAQHWNDLRDMGTGPDDGELNAAGSELQDGDWVLTQDGDDGPYYVIHSDDHAGVEVQTFAAQHSPKGGVSIGGKFYRGGMWIPGKEIEKADAETKEKIEKGKEAAHDERRARGPVNLEQLHGSLEEHANAHELTKQEKGNVGRSYAALKRHHGELLGHRLEELAKTIKEAHDHPDATEGQKDQFSRRLAGLHAMIGRARAEGITGNVTPKVKAEAKPKVEGKPAEKKEEKKPTSGTKDFSKVDKAKVDDKKYEEAKKVDPDSVHLFKHGNAYHLWNDDANGVGKDIGLTVTNRGDTAGAVIFDHRLKENLDKISDLGKNVVVHDGNSHQEYPAKQKEEAKVEVKPTEKAVIQKPPGEDQGNGFFLHEGKYYVDPTKVDEAEKLIGHLKDSALKTKSKKNREEGLRDAGELQAQVDDIRKGVTPESHQRAHDEIKSTADFQKKQKEEKAKSDIEQEPYRNWAKKETKRMYDHLVDFANEHGYIMQLPTVTKNGRELHGDAENLLRMGPDGNVQMWNGQNKHDLTPDKSGYWVNLDNQTLKNMAMSTTKKPFEPSEPPTEQPAQVQPTPKQEQPAATQTTPEVKPDADKVQGGKEPWQMTQDEYAKRPVEPRKVPDLKRMYGSNGPTPQQEIEYKDLKRKYSADKKQFDKDYQEYLGKAYGDGNHESQVRKAVEEGKPVPAEVLADYPDLQAKYAKPTAETKPEPVAQTPTVKPDATASTQTQTPKLNSIRDLYQSPTDTDATVERVQSQGKPPDAQQIAELKKYTGTGNYHRVLNNILRGDSQATEAQQKAIDSVSDYIKSQPPLTEPIPVYRGMKFKTAGEMQNFLDSLKKSHESGEPLTLKGFTSSSPSAITAKTFIKPDGKSNVFMKIDATHGAMLPKSVNDQEAEFLMNHGSQFEVSHISEAPVPTGKGGSAYVVTMKQKPPTTQTQTPAKVEPKTPPQVQTQPKKVAPVKLTPKATPAKVEAKPVEQKPANPVEPPKKVEPAKPTFTPPPKVNQHQGDDYSTNVMSRVMAEMGFRPDTLTDEQADKVAEKVRSIPSREATNQNIQGRQVMSAIYDIKDAWERAKYDPKGGIGEASQNPTTATTTTPTESPVTTTSPQQAKPEAPKKVATDAMRKANPTGDNTQGIIGRDKRGQKETQIDDANGAKVAADLGDDLRKAWQESTLFQEHSDGLVPVDFLYRKVKKEHPDLTMPAFQDALSHLNEKRQLQLHIQNEVHMLKNPNQAIWKDGQAYNYVLMNKPGSQSAQTTGGTTSTAPQQTTPKQSPKNPATTVDNSRKDATIVDSEPVKPNGDAKVENATNVHDVLKSAKEALATHQKKGKNYGKSATDVELGGLSKDDPDWEREEFRLHRAVQDAETAVRAAARNATSAVQPPAEKKTANPEQPVIIRGNTFDVKEKLGKIPGAKYDKHKKVWVVPAKHADEARKLVASAPKKDNSALLKMSNAELAELGLIRDRGSKGPFVRRGTEEELKDYL